MWTQTGQLVWRRLLLLLLLLLLVLLDASMFTAIGMNADAGPAGPRRHDTCSTAFEHTRMHAQVRQLMWRICRC
jgi:hypothetical protein